MPLMKRIKFILKVDGAEARKETGKFWTMFKADPLSPVAFYFKNMGALFLNFFAPLLTVSSLNGLQRWSAL